MINFPDRKVDPTALVRVRHSSGVDYNVLFTKLDDPAAIYLNTYSTSGKLIVQSGATRPISRSEIV